MVVLVHGQAEHVDRYDFMARRWNEMGAMVFGPDHRGQGKSGGSPGHVESFSQYASDLRSLMQKVAAESPGAGPKDIPWFLFGHSMGGLITVTYLIDNLEDPELPLRGAIVSAPLFGVAVKVNPIKQLAAKVMVHVAPRVALDPNMDPGLICRDAKEVEIYKNDPRRTKVVSSGWARAMDDGIARARRELHRIKIPMLWYVGTGDLICDHHETIAAFEALDRPAERDQTLRVFEGYHHELHNEPADLRAPIHEMIDAWLLERVDGPAAKPA